MSNAALAVGDRGPATVSGLGWQFITWGLGLFITGFLTGFVPILHYIHGAIAGDVGPVFLKNMTLWWGCPAVLVELTLKTGGLGMVAIGLAYLAAGRQGASSSISRNERLALRLCSYGLIAMLVCAAVGYVVCNRLWPNFYFAPVQAGKNIWLAAQGLCVAVVFAGFCYAFGGMRRLAR